MCGNQVLRTSVCGAVSHALVCFDDRIDWNFKNFREALCSSISESRFAALECGQHGRRQGQKLGQLGLSHSAEGAKITQIAFVRRYLDELIHGGPEQVSDAFERVNRRCGFAAFPQSDRPCRDADQAGQFSTRHVAHLAMLRNLAGDKASQNPSAHPRNPHMTDHFASPAPMPSQLALLVYYYRLPNSSSEHWEEVTLMHTKSQKHPFPQASAAEGAHLGLDGPLVTVGWPAVAGPPCGGHRRPNGRRIHCGGRQKMRPLDRPPDRAAIPSDSPRGGREGMGCPGRGPDLPSDPSQGRKHQVSNQDLPSNHSFGSSCPTSDRVGTAPNSSSLGATPKLLAFPRAAVVLRNQVGFVQHTKSNSGTYVPVRPLCCWVCRRPAI